MSYKLSGTVLFRFGFVVLIAALAVACQPFGLAPFVAAALGILLAAALNLIAHYLLRAPSALVCRASLGMVLGCSLGLLLSSSLTPELPVLSGTAKFVHSFFAFSGAFLGLLLGLASYNRTGPVSSSPKDPADRSSKLLDTSVLIDGRIAEIARTGFLGQRLVIPKFVLAELHSVADSSDSLKRSRGRRGLELVRKMQESDKIEVRVSDIDLPTIPEVDSKLIATAKMFAAEIVTTDFNLSNVAEIEGIRVLNVNDLANALRPVILPGERMRVFIQKQGKEHSQGIGYLDDGTMVVVEDARRHLAKTVDITVTSVLQSAAGKMIFGRREGNRSEEPGPSAGQI